MTVEALAADIVTLKDRVVVPLFPSATLASPIESDGVWMAVLGTTKSVMLWGAASY